MKIFNFSAGPACLPQSVLKNASAASINYKNSGISLMEMSHRSVDVMELFDKVASVVSQGNVRRGSFAAYLPIEHPDVKEFLRIKS